MSYALIERVVRVYQRHPEYMIFLVFFLSIPIFSSSCLITASTDWLTS